MKEVKAFDVDGKEIQRGDIVKIVNNPNSGHWWLREGHTLAVSYWQDRSFSKVENFICVFLKSKTGHRECSMGIQDVKLKVVDAKKK